VQKDICKVFQVHEQLAVVPHDLQAALTLERRHERSTGRMRRNEIYQLPRVVWAPGAMPGCTKTGMHEQAGIQPMIVYQAAIMRQEALHIPHSDAFTSRTTRLRRSMHMLVC